MGETTEIAWTERRFKKLVEFMWDQPIVWTVAGQREPVIAWATIGERIEHVAYVMPVIIGDAECREFVPARGR